LPETEHFDPMILRKKHVLLIMIAGFSLLARADSTDIEEPTRYKRLELLMNVSNTLSRFTGNGTVQTVFEEPFLIGLKITNKAKTSGLRIGINFSVNKSSEDLNGITKTSDINSWAPLLGYEWRKYLGYNMEFYGGVDGRYYNDRNRTETRSFNGTTDNITVFNTLQQGWGGGPFCGFVYNITPRVSILTEANVYLNYIRKTRNFSTDGTHYETFEDKYTTNITPNAPSALFLVIKF
jgi:hypothetical protein